ncbi:MAG TPA: hypothetical protein VIA06_04750 [Candidatus Dormibacteraeota bacterium]|jgi:hypothetical protein|nr:hypothetical protein [Candidatus Dormibacteraeota bacterium]
MTLVRRVAPAVLLAVLAPLVAEFLLGDFTIRSIGLLLIFLPQYGGGAILVRELARRTGRGWPTILLLALAYGLIEEGLTTQSLFNPNYVGQHLLAYGYIPALRTSLDWCVYVLSLHVVWSISTPILIAEGVSGDRRRTPWLGRIGLAVVAILFVLGCVITIAVTLVSERPPFVAAPGELAAVVVLAALAVAAAFVLFRRRQPGSMPAGRAGALMPPAAGIASLVLASALQLVEQKARPLPAALPVVLMLACWAVALVLLAIFTRRPGWGPRCWSAVAAGTVLTYGWLSLSHFLAGYSNVGGRTGPVDIAGQVVLLLIVLALIAWGVLRSRPATA